jgi:hypothetical protein
MAALARLLFPVPDVQRSTGTIFVWWERRRPTYNLIVGTAGIVTLTVLHGLSWLPGHFDFAAPLALVIVYGICANICYSFGYLFEALLQRLWGDDVAPVGPTLWRHGLVFSVGLTLFPIGLAWIAYLVNATRWFLFGLK